MSTLSIPRRCGQCPAAYRIARDCLCAPCQHAGKPETMHHRAATDECVLDRRTLERFAALFAVRRGLTAETGEEHRLTYTTGGGSDD